MERIFILLVVFQFKHLLMDFVFQTTYMLEKIKMHGWFLPLFSHVAAHSLFTFGIIIVVNRDLWWLAVVDLFIHFSVDRIKASPNLLNRFEFTNKYFWWVFGADQMAHHLTHYWIIWMLVTNTPSLYS